MTRIEELAKLVDNDERNVRDVLAMDPFDPRRAQMLTEVIADCAAHLVAVRDDPEAMSTIWMSTIEKVCWRNLRRALKARKP
jgi:hypothetical protein